MYRNDNLKMYIYKGYTIWCPSTRWITEPLWDDADAIDKFKNTTMQDFQTIADAKKWVRENGAKYKELDFK